MFIKGDVRKFTRTPFITPVKYSVAVLDIRELKRIYDTAVSIDIGTGGLGILTDYPLEEGHVLTFEDETKINNIKSRTAVVKWAGIIDNKYRVGLMFV
jgi:hypothetical protein